jgi:hypothetical protein
MNYQEAKTGSRNGEVEEVESVENGEASGRLG